MNLSQTGENKGPRYCATIDGGGRQLDDKLMILYTNVSDEGAADIGGGNGSLKMYSESAFLFVQPIRAEVSIVPVHGTAVVFA